MNFDKVKLQLVREDHFSYNSQKIKSAIDIVNLINEIENIEHLADESIFLICLDAKNHILAYTELAKGGNNSCSMDLKALFKKVLLTNAQKFILVHNHPTGDTTPSSHDLRLTERIIDASKLLDITFLDHIIIGTKNNYESCMSAI